MTNYKLNDDRVVIPPLYKNCSEEKEGFLQTDKDIACGMIQDSEGNFSIPVVTKTVEELTAEYKGYYLEVISNKLKELDYDSIEMLEIWLDDPVFGTQAQSIKDWYKSVITKNYQILNEINLKNKYNATWVNIIPTKEEYLSELPIYNG